MPTLCGATRGVRSDYKPTFMWWELLMLWRQLFLVGFAILIRPGTVEQAVISFLAAIFFLLLHAVAAPFKADGDNYMGQVSAHRVYTPKEQVGLGKSPHPCR